VRFADQNAQIWPKIFIEGTANTAGNAAENDEGLLKKRIRETENSEHSLENTF
jgi:hypothetical protein